MMHVGVIGCGQLARMIALEAKRMGIRCSFLACDGEPVDCVMGLGDIIDERTLRADSVAFFEALGCPDVVTVERESVSVDLLRQLQAHCVVHPSPDAVSVCQNRLRERRLLGALHIPTAPFVEAHDVHEVAAAVETLGLPVVVKDASAGYDGKHQWRLRDQQDLIEFQHSQSRGEWLVEQWVPFDYEVSVLAARSSSGEMAVYPATRNWHENGILLRSTAPAMKLGQYQEEQAVNYVSSLLQELDYVGVLTVECFVLGSRVLVNELAPRVHNSGHWTQQADITSQFENHLRAILDMPLGSTRLNGHAGFVNMLGVEPGPGCYAALSGSTSLHWYDKLPRVGRKLGHIAVSGVHEADVVQQLDRLHQVLYGKSLGGGTDGTLPRSLAHDAA